MQRRRTACTPHDCATCFPKKALQAPCCHSRHILPRCMKAAALARRRPSHRCRRWSARAPTQELGLRTSLWHGAGTLRRKAARHAAGHRVRAARSQSGHRGPTPRSNGASNPEAQGVATTRPCQRRSARHNRNRSHHHELRPSRRYPLKSNTRTRTRFLSRSASNERESRYRLALSPKTSISHPRRSAPSESVSQPPHPRTAGLQHPPPPCIQSESTSIRDMSRVDSSGCGV
mmetsp:Transcript_99615/g.278963  ORF Transcript_99615/g.278963 Transcript_99615/m.278963 type:complete len:232 (-) Transcript_99615:35-730(-)